VAAAELRRRGLALCKPEPGTKSPTYHGWPKRSLEANEFGYRDLYGIMAGPLSDGNHPGHALVILDLDALEAVEKADQFLPQTAMMEGKPDKPRDHRYYLVPLDSIPEWAHSPAEQAAAAAITAKGHPGPFKKSFDHAQTKKRLIDFIGTGGQAVCPSPGNQRRWEGDAPGEPAIVSFPVLLDAVCRLAADCGAKVPLDQKTDRVPFTLTAEPERVSRARAYVAKRAEAISGQNGHKALWTVVLDLVKGFDLSDAEARPILAVYNRRCQPPWSEQELEHKLNSARASRLPDGYLLAGRNGQAGRQETPPWQQPVPLGETPAAPPPPVDVLPEPLQALVWETAKALNCPPDNALVLVVTMAGGAIGNARHLSITHSHHQPAAVFAAIIGPPGSVKSPVLKLLRRPFDRAQVRYRQEWRQKAKEWEGKPADKRGPRPIMQRCIASDVTTESLCLLLHENPRGLLAIRDELSGLVAGLNQYKSGKGHDRQIYLQLWAGDPVMVDRKSDRTGEPLYVHDPFVAIVGGIQPAVLERLRGVGYRGEPAADDGFVDRFLLSYPVEPQAVGESWAEVSEASLAAWDEAIQHLLSLNMRDEPEGPRPHYVHLTDEGRAAWQAFTESHAAEMNADNFPEHLRGAWAKMRGYCGRLALILTCLRRACQRPGIISTSGEDVTGPDVLGAERLVAYFKGHARKVHALMDADPRVADARRVLRCLATNPALAEKGFSRRDLYQHLRRYFRSPEGLDAPLRLLVELRYLRSILPERGGRPGPNPERFEVNPNWDRRARTQDPRNTQDRSRSGERVDSVDLVYAPETSREPGEEG
jgi:hypothetical protein